MSTAEPSAASSSNRPSPISVAVGVTIVIAVLVGFLVLRGGDDGPGRAGSGTTGATAAQAKPVAATPERLMAFAEARDVSLYWVGPSRGRTYELTEAPDGALYVRYLDGGAEVGDPRPDFLTVGTYPQPDAFETVTKASKNPGAQVERLKDDGLAVANRSRPNSWYLAYPESDELVEVFSPDAGRARELVEAGRVVSVPE
jgi:hypothetical protein